jgi:hypothetical protein
VKYGDVIRKIKRTALGDQSVGVDCGELTPKVQHLLRFCRRLEHSAAQHTTDLVGNGIQATPKLPLPPHTPKKRS